MTKNSRQNSSPDLLSGLFASASRGIVLRTFLLDPHRAYYQRQLEAATGLPLRAVQREVERLSAAGLLYRRMEGNRSYYQVDTDFLFYPELRGMIVKTASKLETLRAVLAVEASVRLAFLAKGENRVLAVLRNGDAGRVNVPEGFSIEAISSEEFLRGLSEPGGRWDAFLKAGVDLLGRRGDPIWRRIEAAGYAVNKEEGVP